MEACDWLIDYYSPASLPVSLVLPHGLDSLLEQGVVAARRQSARQLYVVVKGPKVLNLKL